MKYIAIIFFIVFSSIIIEGQNKPEVCLDTINRYDNDGLKDGCWIEFLSKDFKIVKSKKKAAFYRFVYHIKNNRFENAIQINKPSLFKFSYSTDGNKSNHDEIVLLDGEYSLYIKNNVLLKKFIYKDGILKRYIEYYKFGKIRAVIDYEKRMTNNRFSFSIVSFKENGIIENDGYMFLNNKGEWDYLSAE